MNDKNRRDIYSIEKLIAIIFVSLFVALSAFFILVPDFHSKSALWKAKLHGRDEWSIESNFKGKNKVYKLEVPESFDESQIETKVSLKENEVILTLPGLDAAYPEDYKLKGANDVVSDIYYTFKNEMGMMKFKMTSLHLPNITRDGDTLKIDFEDIKDKYEKIYLVDAALGGSQVGTEFNGVSEKNVNLNIVKEVKKILDEEAPKDAKIYYTRLKDETISEEKRVSEVNFTGCNRFISVGMNSTASGRLSEMKGVATYYLSTKQDSKAFASSCLNKVLETTGAESRGVIPGDENRILEITNTNAIMIKTGYASNAVEREALSQKEYQNKVARGIANAILANIRGE